jgi:hypothetical protein
MAKFSFNNEVFKNNDPEWLARRELQLDKIENIFCDGNKSKKISRKKYFIKGEWYPDSKYDLSFTLKFLLLPEINIDLFYKVMAEIPSEQGKIEYRKGVFEGLLCGTFPTLMEHKSSDFIKLCYEIVDNLEAYSDETFIIEGVMHRRFPLHIERDRESVLFSVFLDRAMEWLTENSKESLTGHTFFIPHWFSGLEYLTCNDFESDFKRDKYLALFTLINHYIPEHSSNPAAKQKLEFVNEFKRYANENGFAKAFLSTLWEQAKQNSEEEWVDDIYECTKENDPELWQSWKPAAFTPLVCKSNSDIGNLQEKIVELFVENGNSLLKEAALVKRNIDISELLTPEFIAELPTECQNQIVGELVSINLTDKYMGTNKTYFQLDIIKIANLPDETEKNIPRLMILERPIDYFVPCFARRYCANQSYMVDEIKAETGFQLVRYFGFSHDLERERTVPPAARDYADYEREMALPFYDAAYLPLKIGNTAFVLNDENEYKYLDN